MRYRPTTLMMLIALCASCTALLAQEPNNWQKANGPDGAMVTALAMDGDGGTYAAIFRKGVYYAPPTNGELTWQRVGGELPSGQMNEPMWSITASRDVDNAMYAATHKSVFRLSRATNTWTEVYMGLETEATNMIVMDSRGIVYCSTAEGKLFKLDKDGTVWHELQVPYQGDMNLAIGRSDMLFVGIGFGGVLRSTDAGATWSTVIEPETTSNREPKLVASPSGDIYSLFRKMQRSTDNGATWTIIPPGPPYGVNKFAVGSHDEIYIGTAGAFEGESGFYMTTDQGVTWTQPVPALKNHILTDIVAGDRCYLGSREEVFRSTDNGGTWEYAAHGLNHATPQIIDVNEHGVIAAGHGDRISISTDGGTSWMDRGMINPDAINPSAIRWDANDKLLVGVELELKQSTDAGITWTNVLTANQVIKEIVSDGQNRMAVLVSNEVPGSRAGVGRIMHSTDGGVQWSSENIGLPRDSGIADIAMDRDGNIYAAVNTVGIFRTTDGGASWTRVYDIHPETTFRKIALHPSGDILAIGLNSISRYSQNPTRTYDHPYESVYFYDIAISDAGYCMLGTADGPMISPDGSDDFAFDSYGPISAFMALDVDREGKFYAGLERDGVWSVKPEVSASAVDRTDLPHISASLALSPNPATDRLVVRYTLPEARQVSIALHDLSGRPVRQLPAGYQTTGDHQVDLDLGDLPAGTYFVGLKLGNITTAAAPFVIRR